MYGIQGICSVKLSAYIADIVITTTASLLDAKTQHSLNEALVSGVVVYSFVS